MVLKMYLFYGQMSVGVLTCWNVGHGRGEVCGRSSLLVLSLVSV